MRRLIAVVAVGLAVLGWTVEAQAACTSHTIMAGGRVVLCTTCCYGNVCNTTCT